MNNTAIRSNIFKTKAGSWKVRWKENNKNFQRTFSTKPEAIVLQSKLINREPLPAKVQKLWFKDFADIWIKRHCEVNIEASTRKDYIQKMSKNILPFFERKFLSEIDEDDVLKYKEWLVRERRFHPTTVGNHIRLLKLMFNCANRWRDDDKKPFIDHNPTKHVKEPKKPEPDFNFWTSQEIKQFLSYVRDKNLTVFRVSLLAVATGMRRGELHQLQRDCLDFENRIVTVKRSFSFVSREVKHTKAKRIRRIPMNEEVYDMLSVFKSLPDEARIFDGVNIEHFHKTLRKWCPLAEVRTVGLHDLRDTFASSLVKSGKKIKLIQYLMGHVDISVTEKYMHLDPDDVECSTDCLLIGF